MEFTLEEITELVNGPLNDEDLYAICEKMCLAVLALDQNQCRKIMITRESVCLGPDGKIKLDIDLHRQNITKDNLLANHVYSIGTVLLWLAKSKSPNRDRDQMLENLMAEMMNTSPTDRPTLEIVSQACEMILQQYQVSSNDILNVMHDDCTRNPIASKIVEKRSRHNLKGPVIKPRTKSPYQLVSIEDKGGELRDGSLIEETTVVEIEEQKTESEQGRLDPDESSSSQDTHDILDETDLDSNPATEGTWDYDHMDVTADEEGGVNREESPDKHTTEEKEDLAAKPATIMSKQTSEDREVEKFTGQSKDLLTAPPTLYDNTSESGESTNKEPANDAEEPPTNRFRSLSDHTRSIDENGDLTKPKVVPVAVPAALTQHSKEEVIESKDANDNETGEEEIITTVAAPFIKKPSKPKPKPADLWKKAGMSIKSKLNLPSNKGLMGVIKQAEAQGQLKPKFFNRNITKAISAMAKKQAYREKSDDRNNDPVKSQDDKADEVAVKKDTTDKIENKHKESEEVTKDIESTKPQESKEEQSEKSQQKPNRVPPPVAPKPQLANIKHGSLRPGPTDCKSTDKSGKSTKVKKDPVSVTRRRSSSVTTKKELTVDKDTKPRRKSISGPVHVSLTKDKKAPKAADKTVTITKPKASINAKIQKTVTPKVKPPLAKSTAVTDNKTHKVQRKTSTPSPSVASKSSISSPSLETQRKVSVPSPATQRKVSASSPATQRKVSASSPATQRKVSVPSPATQRKVSVPSPATQRKVSVPSPSIQRKVPAASPVTKRKVSAPSPLIKKKISIPKKTVEAPTIQRRASLTKPMAKPKMKTIPEKKEGAAVKRKESLSSATPTSKPLTPTARRRSVGAIKTSQNKSTNKKTPPPVAKKPAKKNSQEEPEAEYEPVMVPRKDLVVDKNSPGFKRNERILSIGSPKHETYDSKPHDTSPKSTEIDEDVKTEECIPSKLATNCGTELETETLPVYQNEDNTVSDTLRTEKELEEQLTETEQSQDGELPLPREPLAQIKEPQQPTEKSPQLTEESPKPTEEPYTEETDQKETEDELPINDLVNVKTMPPTNGIADLNNLNSSFEIALQLDPPLVDDLFLVDYPDDMINITRPPEITFDSVTEEEPGPILDTILETSKESELTDVSGELIKGFEPDILSDSETEEETERARQDQMKKLLDDPQIKPADLPEVSIKETGKQNRSPSSKYKMIKSIGKKTTPTETPKVESEYTFKPIRQQPDSSDEAEPENESCNLPGPISNQTPIPQDVIKGTDDIVEPLTSESHEHNVGKDLPISLDKEDIETQPIEQETDTKVDEIPQTIELVENSRQPVETVDKVRAMIDTQPEAMFKPIDPAEKEPTLSEENEDSFYPKLEVQKNPMYRSPSPVAIMRDLVKPLNFSKEMVSLEELMKVLDRPLGENELWLLLLGTVKSLQSTTVTSALNPAMIGIDNNGHVHISEVHDEIIRSENTNRKLEEQKAVFSVGACLWYCADYGLQEDDEPLLSRALQNLLVDMTQTNVQDRPTLQQLVEEYRKYMGEDDKRLKTLYNQYRALVRTMSGSALTQQQSTSQPSIQIIINKDDMVNRSTRLDPSITINERTADDFNRSRVIQFPLRVNENTDNILRGLTPNPRPVGEPVSFMDKRMVASTPNPVHTETEAQCADFLSVENPEISPPVQAMKTSAQRNRRAGRKPDNRLLENIDDVEMFDIPDIEFTEPTLSFSKDFESLNTSLSPTSEKQGTNEINHRYEDLYNPSHYINLSDAPKERADKQISDGEYEPDIQAFTNLSEGMNCLRSQVNKLYDEDNPLHYTTPAKGRVSPRDLCATPMTSSPLNSSEDELDEFSLSPIKDITFEESNILDKALDIERPVQKQLVRRASIAETLTQLKSEGKIPAESSGALQDIMSLLELEVDINDVLEYLEKRIEVNIDRLESGDTVVNALAGIESDIEFKLLQVEAMRKVTKRDDDELSRIHGESGGSRSPLDLSSSRSDLRISDHSEPKREEIIPRGQVIRTSRETVDGGGLDQLNVEILEHLREISKSPLHFADSEEDDDNVFPKLEPDNQYNLMQSIIEKHSPLLSPRAVKPPANNPYVNTEQTKDIHESPKETNKSSVTSYFPPKSAKNSQMFSIPKDQLMMFFQRHLPEQDSSDVMESLGGNILNISSGSDKEDAMACSKPVPQPVMGTYRKIDLTVIDEKEEVTTPQRRKVEGRLESTCSVEERVNLSAEGSTSEGEGSVTTFRHKTEISSAYGRTSPDGAYSSSNSDTDMQYPSFDIGPVILPTKRQLNTQPSTYSSISRITPSLVEYQPPPNYFDKNADKTPYLASYQLPALT